MRTVYMSHVTGTVINEIIQNPQHYEVNSNSILISQTKQLGHKFKNFPRLYSWSAMELRQSKADTLFLPQRGWKHKHMITIKSQPLRDRSLR